VNELLYVTELCKLIDGTNTRLPQYSKRVTLLTSL